MVEQDVIYEEIKFRRDQFRKSDGDESGALEVGNNNNSNDRSETPPLQPEIDLIQLDYIVDNNSLYEDMNGLGDELARKYNIHNVNESKHRQEYGKDDDNSVSNVKTLVRIPSNSSSESSFHSLSYGKYPPQQHRQHQPINSRSSVSSCADEFTRTFSFTDAETIYTEIVTNQDVTEEITTGRITRESENPILRQSKFSVDKKAMSLSNINNGFLLDECLYGSIDHLNAHYLKIQSLDRRNNIKNKRHSINLYENSNYLFSTNSNSSSKEIYENSNTMNSATNHLADLDSRVPLCSKCSELQNDLDEKRKELIMQDITRSARSTRSTLSTRSTRSACSLYENVQDMEEDLYENLSENECVDDLHRERSSSTPIEITTGLPQPQHQNNRPRMKRGDGSFDENDDKKTSIPPFSISSMSSSVTSSPRGSICDSITSELSSVPPRSTSPPPPLPLSRKRNTGNNSWTNMSAFSGLNYFPANYLGKQQVTKATPDNIDLAVSHVAQNTNLLEMKPVYTEVTHELIRIGSTSSPWEVLGMFKIEDIITYDVITKNVSFLGIVAGEPGCEACCYVLQSEKSNEISDAIKQAFQTVPNKIQRCRSSYEINVQPEFHRFQKLVKIGSAKVRRSFHCVNDYINLVLEKENPKDFRSVNLEVLGANVVIYDIETHEETSHSTPSILSLGVYAKDKRYFGYIITEVTTANKKERVQCYVYRTERNNQAAKIIDAISTSYQAAYAPRVSDSCEINPIYSAGLHLTNSSNSPNAIYSKYVNNAYRRRNSMGTASTTKSQQLSPYSPNTSRTSINSNNENGRRSGRNSVISLESTVSSQASVQHSLESSSPDTSPLSERYILTKPLSDRINHPPVKNKRFSENLENIYKPTEIHENSILSMGDGSTETLLTLTPKTLSNSSLPRSSPLTKNKRPKSLPIIDFQDEQMISKNHLSNHKSSRESEHRKPKHKSLFGKLRGSMKMKHTFVAVEKEISCDSPTTDRYNTLPNPAELNNILHPSIHLFDVAYICSTVVNPPLRPKHVRDCYKQFTKEMSKAGKHSHNNRLKTIGSAVKLKIDTNQEITMLDPNDENTVIRNFPVEMFDKFIFHPDPTMGCFAFSTTVPENIKHKCHLFVVPNDVRDSLTDVFCRIDRLKDQKNQFI